jgi:hypothetical protein
MRSSTILFALFALVVSLIPASSRPRVSGTQQCERQATECLGKCAGMEDMTSYERCVPACDKQRTRCLRNARPSAQTR